MNETKAYAACYMGVNINFDTISFFLART